MKPKVVTRSAGLGAGVLAAIALAQPGAPDAGRPGWTGVTEPKAVIAARQALMTEIERLMRPIDTYAATGTGDPAALREAAQSIAAMLQAVPHLFPPTTDLFDPDAESPATLALPAVWQNFAGFERFADAATDAANALADADEAELQTAAVGLRAACDGCHAPFLRPYAGPEVSTEDLEFDFESVLPPE